MFASRNTGFSLVVLVVSAAALGCSAEDSDSADAGIDAAASVCHSDLFTAHEYPLQDAEGVADGGMSACRPLCAAHLPEVKDGYGVANCQILGAVDEEAPQLACTFTLTSTPENDPCYGK